MDDFKLDLMRQQLLKNEQLLSHLIFTVSELTKEVKRLKTQGEKQNGKNY